MDTLPADLTLPPSLSFGVPDSAIGFDNHDIWPVASGGYRAQSNHDEYNNYVGDKFDYFRIDLEPVLPDTTNPWNRDEFSFRTNPSCAWYNPQVSGFWYRTNPQRIPNSLIVRIKSQYNDYDPLREPPEPHMIVDFLSAPYENIVYPNGGETLRSDEPVTIEWETTFAEITTVDILYSLDGGSTYPDSLTIATGIAASTGQYVWTPNADYASNTAKIRIVYYHNLGTAYVGDDTSDATFCMLGASKAVFKNTKVESELDYAGNPYSSVGFEYDYNAQDDRNFADLMITIASGGLTSVLNHAAAVISNGVPVFEDVTSDAFSSGIRPQIGLGGVSVADMDNDGDLDLFCAAGASTAPSSPRLYRNKGDGTFADVTDSLGLASLAANSWAGAWSDYDRDGWVDLFITRGGETGDPPESMGSRPAYLLRNGLEPNLGTGGFQDVTASVGLSTNGANVAASISACWGDINNDNRLDLYLAEYRLNTAGVSGKLFVQQSNGTFQDETSSRLTIGLLIGQAATQFADMDQDGDVDLVVGTRLANAGAHVFWNNGSGYFDEESPLTVPSVGGVSGMKIWDQDLDLRSDLLLTTRDTQQTSHFFHNLKSAAGIVLLDETSHVGLDEGHEAGGLTTLDWNRDGDKDVYFGRATASQNFFFRTTTEDTSQSLGKHFIQREAVLAAGGEQSGGDRGAGLD